MSPVLALPFSRGNDLAFEVYIPPAPAPVTGILTPYPGTSITGWIAEASAPDTPLNGTTGTFPMLSAGRFLWLFESAAVDACLASLSPAPVAGQTFYAVARGAGEFTVYRKLRYEVALVVP